jgi:hypothetical protein
VKIIGVWSFNAHVLTWLTKISIYEVVHVWYAGPDGRTLACAPKVRTQIGKNYSPLGEYEEIIVFGLGERFPAGAEELGTVRISDTGFTLACTYEIVIEKAKIQARKAGGNALVITEHKAPNFFGSSCHQIQAKIIRLPKNNWKQTLIIKKSGRNVF